MTISRLTVPIDSDPPLAYLNGITMGYGELVETTRYAELWSGTGFAERVPTRTEVKGEIYIPGEYRQDTLNLIMPWPPERELRFSGYIRGRGYLRCVRETPVWVVRYQEEFEWGYGSRTATIELQQIPSWHITKLPTLCDRCCYFMRGNPSICNAFHPEVGVSECADFRE